MAILTPQCCLSALLYLRWNIILLGVKVILYQVAFFARKVVQFLSSTIVYIISPIYRNLANVRVNVVLVLISSSNRPCITTQARISLVMDYLSFFTKGEIVVQWGKMDHCLVPWHFPIYIKPSASFLLSLPYLLYTNRTYQNIFFSFLTD